MLYNTRPCLKHTSFFMSLYTYIKYDTDMWKYIEKVYYADSKLKKATVSIFITAIKRNKLLIEMTK